MSDEFRSIVRTNKNKNYTVIDNQPLSDIRLSWKARGILAFILTRPDDWKFHVSELIKWSKIDGESSFRAGWKELKDAGYIERVPIREGQRITHWETIIHEIPLDVDFPQVENLPDGKPTDKKTYLVENRGLLNTNLLPNTKRDSNKDIVPQAEQVGFELAVPEPVDNKAQLISDVIHHLNVKANKSFSADTKETVKFIGARSKQGATLETFKHVIDVKCLEWLGTDQEIYLRPKTLFSESNFEAYKQQTIEQVMEKKNKANGNTPKQPSFLQNKLMGGANGDGNRIDVTPGYGGNNPRAIGTGSTHT